MTYDKAIAGLSAEQIAAAASAFIGRAVTGDIQAAVLAHAQIEGGLGGFVGECDDQRNPHGCGCGAAHG